MAMETLQVLNFTQFRTSVNCVADFLVKAISGCNPLGLNAKAKCLKSAKQTDHSEFAAN